MSKSSEYLVKNLARAARKQGPGVKEILNRPRPIGKHQQVRRYLAGEERHRLENGGITAEQYFRYIRKMGKILEVL